MMLRAAKKLIGAAMIVPAVVASNAMKMVTMMLLNTSFNAWLGIRFPNRNEGQSLQMAGSSICRGRDGTHFDLGSETAQSASVVANFENRVFPVGRSHWSLTGLLGAMLVPWTGHNVPRIGASGTYEDKRSACGCLRGRG